MASRYKGVKSKRKIQTSKFRPVDSSLHLETTYYEKVPEENTDMYFLAQEGDRFDHLADRFYGDSQLWWFLARTNNLSTNNIPAGTQIRIPTTAKHAKIIMNNQVKRF